MDIQAELMKLDRARALRIIADTLRHLSDSTHTLAICFAFKRAIELRESLDVHFIGLPPSDAPADCHAEVDEGCDVGGCAQCRVNLASSYKRVNCPFCGTEARLT